MLREYHVYPWHLGGPDEFYPSELNALVDDLRDVQAAMQKQAGRG